MKRRFVALLAGVLPVAGFVPFAHAAGPLDGLPAAPDPTAAVASAVATVQEALAALGVATDIPLETPSELPLDTPSEVGALTGAVGAAAGLAEAVIGDVGLPLEIPSVPDAAWIVPVPAMPDVADAADALAGAVATAESVLADPAGAAGGLLAGAGVPLDIPALPLDVPALPDITGALAPVTEAVTGLLPVQLPAL